LGKLFRKAAIVLAISFGFTKKSVILVAFTSPKILIAFHSLLSPFPNHPFLLNAVGTD
jgi:hypothetical protein